MVRPQSQIANRKSKIDFTLPTAPSAEFSLDLGVAALSEFVHLTSILPSEKESCRLVHCSESPVVAPRRASPSPQFDRLPALKSCLGLPQPRSGFRVCLCSEVFGLPEIGRGLPPKSLVLSYLGYLKAKGKRWGSVSCGLGTGLVPL